MKNYNEKIPQAGIKYLSFRLDGVLYGIDARYVREISINSPVSSTGFHPGYITGMSLTDTPAPIIDLAAKLGLKNAAGKELCYLITLELDSGDKKVSLAFTTSSIEEMLEIYPDDEHYFPEDSAGANPFTRKGYSRKNRRLISIIDPAILFSEEILRFIERDEDEKS